MPGKTLKRLLITVVLLGGGGTVAAQEQASPPPANHPKVKAFRIERSLSPQALACIECHRAHSPGIFIDWTMSRHAGASISCLDCHQAEPFDADVSQEHFKQYERSDQPYGTRDYRVPVSAVVTPKDCSRCHPDEALQYGRSKHANTVEIMWKIDPWLNQGLNSEIERTSGCYACHGTVLKMTDGRLDPATWPNVGVGRINLDGSKGSCTSCHTRHRFSVMEARKPGACGQCHLGPDHPQIEIYMESKHGGIYEAFGDQYNWEGAPGTWTAGVDYRGPTCASCHMSGAGRVATSHDASERLSWELQAPLTVRPEAFAPFPSGSGWQVERDKMKEVCIQCHGKGWVDDHYTKLDRVVLEYAGTYYTPARAMMDTLYEKQLLDPPLFNERLEIEFYELWHHEGRRARMGAAMMAPDYTWWHGFYECKKRFMDVMERGRELLRTGKKAEAFEPFPGGTGSREKPPEVFAAKP